MFYSTELLTRKGVFAIAWIAGTCPNARYKYIKYINSNSKHDLIEICENIYYPIAPLSLRLRGTLLLGVCVLFKESVLSFEKDLMRVWKSLQNSITNDHLLRACQIVSLDTYLSRGEAMSHINLQEDSAKLNSITLPLRIPSNDFDDEDLEFDESIDEDDELDVARNAFTIHRDNADRFSLILNDFYFEDELEPGRGIDSMSIKQQDDLTEYEWHHSQQGSIRHFDIPSSFKDEDHESMMNDLDPYVLTELDLLQNEEDEDPIDVEAINFDDTFLSIQQDEGFDKSPTKSEIESKVLVVPRKKKPAIIVDETTELSSELIQSWIDHPERHYDTKRIEMLHNSDKLIVHHHRKRLLASAIDALDTCGLSIKPVCANEPLKNLYTTIADEMRKRIKTVELKNDTIRGNIQHSELDSIIDSMHHEENFPLNLSPIKDAISDEGWEPFLPSTPISHGVQSNAKSSPSLELDIIDPPKKKDDDVIFQETRQSKKLLRYIETKSRNTSPKIKHPESDVSCSSSISSNLSRDGMKYSPIKEEPPLSERGGKWLEFDDMILVLSSSGHVDVSQKDSYDSIYVSVI